MVGGSTPPPTQTAQYTLGPDQKAILDAAMPSITNYGATTPQRYQGSTIAGFTDPEIAGQQAALKAASGQDTLASSAAGYTNARLTTDPNAMRDEAIAAAQRPIYNNLTERVLPGIASGTAVSGPYGGSRQAIADKFAIEDANTQASDVAAKISSQIYGTDVGAQLQALGAIPQTQQAQTSGATTTSGVGDVQRGYNQQLLDEVVSNFNFDTNNPADLAKAQDLVALLGGIPEGGTTATGSVPPTNTLGQVLGGAGTGAAIGNMIVPGAGAAVGGVAGGVLPFLFPK